MGVALVGLAGGAAARRDRRPHDEVLELPAAGPGGGVQADGERGRAVVRRAEAVGGGRMRGLQLEHAGDGTQPVGPVQQCGGVLGPGRVVLDGHQLHVLLAPSSREQRLEPGPDAAAVGGHQRQPLGAPVHQEVGHLQPDVAETACENTPRSGQEVSRYKR